MNFSWFKWRYFLYLAIFGVWSIWLINMQVLTGASYIAPDCGKNVDNYPVVIVLGAGVSGTDKISDIYADRLKVAVNIYKSGKVAKILVSGDHGQINYDEVNAGKNYLLGEGVPVRDIFLDHAGFDTYSSIYRAKNIFNINRALVVTQDFHLPRALYLSKKIGIEALGCSADLHEYKDIKYLKQREVLARVKAWSSIALGITPKYLGEVFDISGNGDQTWDQSY
jgi:vancomycin permeability regulator SanA